MGNDNYYPIARENWYPSSSEGLGDYATYHMTFHVPKGLQFDRHRHKEVSGSQRRQVFTNIRLEH